MSDANDTLAGLITNSATFSAAVNSIVDERVKSSSRTVTINIDSVKRGEAEGHFHKDFETIATVLQCGNVLIVGPAGCGKTTLCEQVAKLMNIRFYFNGAINQEHKLTGFVDGHGKYQSTPFRQAFEHGGLYLFDEIDGSSANALLAFNAALSNGMMDFPDKNVRAHKDLKIIAAANTYGNGKNRIYVGRNQQDGASMDRFAPISIDYDEELERSMTDRQDWCDYVHAVRAQVTDRKIRHIVSTRAIVLGSRLLSTGLAIDLIKSIAVYKGLDDDVSAAIEKSIPAAIRNIKVKAAKTAVVTPIKPEAKPEAKAVEPEAKQATLDGFPEFDDIFEDMDSMEGV